MRVTLGRSKLILAYLLLVHAAAMFLVNLYGSITLRLISTGLILGSLVHYCRIYGWWFGQQPLITGLRTDDGTWFLSKQGGHELGPMRLVRSVMLGPFIAIYFSTPQRWINRSLLIVRDAVDSQDWRQLRVRLRDPEAWG